MTVDFNVVDLSRLQFALTALYHFLFVPLTLGLSMLLVVMESVYVMTGRPIWRQMTRFWGMLFGINFAMGVATGITMEFQFGTNWAYYSHYVGDSLGALGKNKPGLATQFNVSTWTIGKKVNLPAASSGRVYSSRGSPAPVLLRLLRGRSCGARRARSGATVRV